MSISATAAPAPANPSALARPMPDAAPVTSAHFPVSGTCTWPSRGRPGRSIAGVVALQRGAQGGAAAVQQNPLILLGQLQGRAGLVGGHPLHVAHLHDQPLPLRKVV